MEDVMIMLEDTVFPKYFTFAGKLGIANLYISLSPFGDNVDHIFLSLWNIIIGCQANSQ